MSSKGEWKNWIDEDAPVAAASWCFKTDKEREDLVRENLLRWQTEDVRDDAQAISFESLVGLTDVYVSFSIPISASYRADVLMALERCLKLQLDQALVVWCRPTQDRNALRRLRGVKV